MWKPRILASSVLLSIMANISHSQRPRKERGARGGARSHRRQTDKRTGKRRRERRSRLNETEEERQSVGKEEKVTETSR